MVQEQVFFFVQSLNQEQSLVNALEQRAQEQVQSLIEVVQVQNDQEQLRSDQVLVGDQVLTAEGD